MVLAMIGPANHDPAAFADPSRIDVTRQPDPHLALGHGAHFCLGAPLARLEASIALDELLNLPRLRRADTGPWTPRRALHVHGPTTLPIRFDASSAS
jgi:cytochrome P450